MEKLLEKLFDIKKIPTKLIFVIWLSCTLVLFVPENWLAKLNLRDFLAEYGKYIGILFILSSGFLLVSIFNYVSHLIFKEKFERKFKGEILKEINQLDYHEKALLREFFIHGKHTLQLPFDNDTVIGLTNKGIIYRASNTGFTYIYGAYFPFSISDIARNNLTYQLIDLPIDPTEADKERIFEQRPNWAKEKSRIENRLNARW